MLRKLIKYEWKAVWKVLLIINAFTVLTTLTGLLALHALKNSYGSHDVDSVAVFIFIMYYLTIAGVSFAMAIYTGIRFYRNLYTDEGYLMHTLPVTGRQLVLSKLAVHTLCQTVTQIAVMISVCLLMFPLLAWLTDEPDPFLSNLFADMLEQLQSMGISLPLLLLTGLVSGVVSTLSTILSIYCAISLGQTFHGHRVMGSVLCYVGLYCLIQSVNGVILMPQINIIGKTGFNFTAYLFHVIIITGIISLILGIIWYCIILYTMNKKLNLD